MGKMKNLMMHKESAKGMFDELPEYDQEIILEVVACFHYRDDVSHEDGSRGTIKITPNELKDILAYVATEYYCQRLPNM